MRDGGAAGAGPAQITPVFLCAVIEQHRHVAARPFRCGSTTCKVNAVATAASKALPPAPEFAMPTAVAIQCVEVTTPNVPSISAAGERVGIDVACHGSRPVGRSLYYAIESMKVPRARIIAPLLRFRSMMPGCWAKRAVIAAPLDRARRRARSGQGIHRRGDDAGP